MSFVRLDPQDFLVSADSITGTAWSGNSPTLTSFFTSSTQVSSSTGIYYTQVNQSATTAADSAVQFDILYCDIEGSGSFLYNPVVTGSSPTRTMYGSYRTLVLGDENSQFVFGAFTSSYFYVLSVERSRYKESLFPGTFNLTLNNGGDTLKLTDNSGVVGIKQYNDAGRVYQIISGSNGSPFTGTYINTDGYTVNSGSYGLFLPDIGTIILNGEALDGTLTNGGINMAISRSNNAFGKNMDRMYYAIDNGANFSVNSDETITSDYVFVRARNTEFNYTENPSFISGSTGEVIYPLFIESPTTYITTVGLYNDANELLAVSKLSRPLAKDFTKELLMRVKLDF